MKTNLYFSTMKQKIVTFILVLSMSVGLVDATIRLPYLFGDNMVLQQQMLAPIWGKTTPGSILKVKVGWDKTLYTVKADSEGRWRLKVQTPKAGGPYEILLTEGKELLTLKDVYIGEVWILGGQSNMELPMKGFRDQPVDGSNMELLKSAGKQIHLFKVTRRSTTVEQDTVKKAAWESASPATLGEFSATGWFFAKMLYEQLNVPIGLVSCNYSGSCVEAWMRPELLTGYGDYKIPGPTDPIPVVNRTPTTLYKAMLHPIVGYAIRGCIWYQGESNYTNPDRYEKLFPAMVNDWRALWGQGDFPFYYAQIAPFDYKTLKESNYLNSAFLRDAQRKMESKIPHSGMIVLLDAGDEKGIHPRNKAVVGERFALQALANTYGIKGIGYTAPRYKSMEVHGQEVTVNFDDAPMGLTSYGKELVNFEIAGNDKVFYPAQARVVAGKIVVSSPKVTEPVAVRYAFKDYVQGDLYGANGLPVSSFRTDDWEEK
jgi:sialate O-acetylesterase